MNDRRRRAQVAFLALSTVLVFGVGGAALIVFVQQRDLLTVIFGAGDVAVQLAMGTVTGLLLAGTAWWIVRRPYMRPVSERYVGLVGALIRTPGERVLVSACAGIGEELFFRGALQHWLGIPITAILFVAIHGYLDPRDWRTSSYGLYMTLGMVLLGWQAERYGLLAPMVAHTLIDIVLLDRLARRWKEKQASEALVQDL
jgi:uncharacterized protein